MSAVLTLCPFTIDPDEAGRIGLFFPAKAEALGVLMKRDGQIVEIKVTKAPKGSQLEWKLVYGLHRLRGAMWAGIDIKAIEVSGTPAELLAMQEAENSKRRELEPLERAMFVAEVVRAAMLRAYDEYGVSSAQALGGKAKAGKVQYSAAEKADELAEAAVDNLSIAYGWKAQAAEALGLGPKDLQRSMRIHRCIIEPFGDLIPVFKDHPVAKVAENLAQICTIRDEAKRRYVIEVLIAGARTLPEAMLSAGIAPPKPEMQPYQKHLNAMTGAALRLGTQEWRRACVEFVGALRPAQKSELLAALQGAEKPSAVTHYQDLAAQAAEEAA